MNKVKLSSEGTARFCQGLSLLLHAGIGTGEGLFFLAQEQDDAAGQIAAQMGHMVDAGSSLADAMEKCGDFPAYVLGMVRTGEQTGRLEEALLSLADYYDEQERMEKRMRNTLTYPSVLMLMMLLVMGVLLIWVLPVFEGVYTMLGSSLTGLAGVFLLLGELLKKALPVICVLLAVFVVLLLFFFYNTSVREKILTVVRRKWGDRSVFRKLNDAHMAQALAMGLRSGLMVEEAMELALQLLQDIPEASARCQKCLEQLREQGTLAEALKTAGVLPESAARLLEIGVRSGNAEQVMEEIAVRLEEEAVWEMHQKVGRIEPAMVLVMSIMVGVILLAVMLPLINIMSAIG